MERFKRMPPTDVGAGTRLCFDQCVLLELRHLWVSDVTKLKQVWFLDIPDFTISFISSRKISMFHGKMATAPGQLYAELKWRAGKGWWQGEKVCKDTLSTPQRSSGRSSEKPQSLGTAAQNRDLQTFIFPGSEKPYCPAFWVKTTNRQTDRQTNRQTDKRIPRQPIPNVPLENPYLTFLISLTNISGRENTLK